MTMVRQVVSKVSTLMELPEAMAAVIFDCSTVLRAFLTKSNPGLKNVLVGLGWDINRFDSGSDFDLDASAFLVQETHYHGCLNGEILTQIITNNFLIGVSVDQTNKRIGQTMELMQNRREKWA